MDVIVQKFAQYFSSVFTIMITVNCMSEIKLPCDYPFNVLIIKEKIMVLNIGKPTALDNINAHAYKLY